MAAKVLDCVADLKAKIQTVPGLANRVLFAYDKKDFTDKIKGIKSYPGIGIVYGGTHAVAEIQPSGKLGISNKLLMTIVLIDQGTGILSTDSVKELDLNYLDSLRTVILGTRSPTGHFWQFLAETPATLESGMTFWTQTWITPVQFNPGK